RQVLTDSQAIEQLVDLIALGQPELARIRHSLASDVLALEKDLARCRLYLACEHLEEGGLASPVRADNAAQLAVIDGEIDVAVGSEAPVVLGQALGLQDRTGLAVGFTVTRRHDGDRRLARYLKDGGLLLVLGSGAGDGCILGRLGFFLGTGQEGGEVLDTTNQAAAQETHQQDEYEAEDELPGCTKMKRGLQEVVQIEPDGRPYQRPEQRAGATDRRHHHELPGRVEHESVRRHKTLHEPEQPAGKTGIGRGNDKGREFVPVDIVADSGSAHRIVADSTQYRADRRAHNPQRQHGADEVPERQERIERPIGVEVDGGEAEIECRRWHAGQTILAAGEIREWIELDEEKDLRDRHGDHGEIDASAPERDQSDQIADHGRHDRADEQ